MLLSSTLTLLDFSYGQNVEFPDYNFQTTESTITSKVNEFAENYENEKSSINECAIESIDAILSSNNSSSNVYCDISEYIVSYPKPMTAMVPESIHDWEKLSIDTQEQRSWLFYRPTESSWVNYDLGNPHYLPKLYSSPSGHFLLHWTNGADGGSPDDATTLAYVQQCAETFDYVWNFEVNIRGYAPPPDDLNNPPNDPENTNPDGKYDIYIFDCLDFNANGVTFDFSESGTSAIGIDNDFSIYTSGVRLGFMQATAAHEFFHAISCTYTQSDYLWWEEGCTTYMEDEVYPNVNKNYYRLPDWFEYCGKFGLFYEDIYEDIYHWYGNFIFVKHLSEEFGDEIIKDIWERIQTEDAFTAIDNVLDSKGSSFRNEFNKFTLANYFLEDFYIDGVDYRNFLIGRTTYDGVWVEYQYREATDGLPFSINSTNVSDDTWMDAWATDYVTLEMSGATSKYLINFNGLDNSVQYDVSLAIKTAGDEIEETYFILNSQKDGQIELNYSTDYTQVVLIIRNSAGYCPQKPLWSISIEPEELCIEIVSAHGIESGSIAVSPGQSFTVSVVSPTNVIQEQSRWVCTGFTINGGSPQSGITYTFTNIQESQTIEFFWIQQYYLKINSPHGSTSGSGWYDTGTTATARLDSGTISAGTGTQYVFTNWDTDASGTGLSSNGILMNGPKTASANWKTQYYLTVQSQHGTTSGQGWYDGGTSACATVNSLETAEINGVKHIFSGWSVDASGTGLSSNGILMNGPKTASANWKTQYYLDISTNYGTVTPKSGWYDANSIVEVSAQAPTNSSNERFVWVCWNGTHNSSYKKFSITINQPITEVGNWQHQYWLEIDSPYGNPTLNSGWYNENELIKISINDTPIDNSILTRQIYSGWTGTGSAPSSGGTADIQFTIKQPSKIDFIWISQFYLSTTILLVLAVSIISIIALALVLYRKKHKQYIRIQKEQSPIPPPP